jgi:hypothetical protein
VIGRPAYRRTCLDASVRAKIAVHYLSLRFLRRGQQGRAQPRFPSSSAARPYTSHTSRPVILSVCSHCSISVVKDTVHSRKRLKINRIARVGSTPHSTLDPSRLLYLLPTLVPDKQLLDSDAEPRSRADAAGAQGGQIVTGPVKRGPRIETCEPAEPPAWGP